MTPMTALVPRLSDHFGAWAIEAGTAYGLLDNGKSILARLPEHVAANAEKTSAANAKSMLMVKDSIAFIRLQGALMKAESSVDSSSSTIRVRQQFKEAASRDDVAGIVLFVDSPGGTVAGTADLSAAIAAAAKVKPVRAFVEDMCCSAAYWAASQANSITANNATAMIGSIGTILVLTDTSAAAEKAGIRPVIISTGALKGSGAPGAPITAEQQAYFQGLVDAAQVEFSAAIASGRSLSAEAVADLATGQIWRAKEAQSLGLIDSIASFDDFLAEFRASLSPDATQNSPQGNQKMNIFAKVFGTKDEADAKNRLEEIEAKHTTELKASADQIAALTTAVETAKADHLIALAAVEKEAEARASLIITGLCDRKLTKAEAVAAMKLPSAELAAKLEGATLSVPPVAPKVVTQTEDEIRAAFEAETDQTKSLAMLKAYPFLAKPKATQE